MTKEDLDTLREAFIAGMNVGHAQTVDSCFACDVDEQRDEADSFLVENSIASEEDVCA